MAGRVVFVTQRIDPAHPTLGAAVSMVRALAARVDEVTVIALEAVDGALPPNCRVRTMGAPSRGARGARFAAALTAELRPRPAAVIAHMSPVYAVLAAPVCRPLGIPVILWFTHWKPSRLLRLAERVSTVVATADRSSFPLAESRKVRAIGHAIDVDELPCTERPDGTPLRALALGRTSRIKGLETLIAGVREARGRGVEVELELRGASETPDEEAYRSELVTFAGPDVRVEEPVPRTRLAELFARTDLLVNATTAGSLDKAVLEACACCVPAMASSPGFASFLPDELRFPPGDGHAVADRIEAFARLDHAARERLGRELRRRVVEQHSSQHWAASILALADVT